MSSVNGLGGNLPIQKPASTPAPRTEAAQAPAAPQRGADRLELSGMGHLLQALKTGTDYRADKVADIKARIEAGTYETPDKLDIAVDRLLDDLDR